MVQTTAYVHERSGLHNLPAGGTTALDFFGDFGLSTFERSVQKLLHTYQTPACPSNKWIRTHYALTSSPHSWYQNNQLKMHFALGPFQGMLFLRYSESRSRSSNDRHVPLFENAQVSFPLKDLKTSRWTTVGGPSELTSKGEDHTSLYDDVSRLPPVASSHWG